MAPKRQTEPSKNIPAKKVKKFSSAPLALLLKGFELGNKKFVAHFSLHTIQNSIINRQAIGIALEDVFYGSTKDDVFTAAESIMAKKEKMNIEDFFIHEQTSFGKKKADKVICFLFKDCYSVLYCLFYEHSKEQPELTCCIVEREGKTLQLGDTVHVLQMAADNLLDSIDQKSELPHCEVYEKVSLKVIVSQDESIAIVNLLQRDMLATVLDVGLKAYVYETDSKSYCPQIALVEEDGCLRVKLFLKSDKFVRIVINRYVGTARGAHEKRIASIGYEHFKIVPVLSDDQNEFIPEPVSSLNLFEMLQFNYLLVKKLGVNEQDFMKYCSSIRDFYGRSVIPFVFIYKQTDLAKKLYPTLDFKAKQVDRLGYEFSNYLGHLLQTGAIVLDDNDMSKQNPKHLLKRRVFTLEELNDIFYNDTYSMKSIMEDKFPKVFNTDNGYSKTIYNYYRQSKELLLRLKNPEPTMVTVVGPCFSGKSFVISRIALAHLGLPENTSLLVSIGHGSSNSITKYPSIVCFNPSQDDQRVHLRVYTLIKENADQLDSKKSFNEWKGLMECKEEKFEHQSLQQNIAALNKFLNDNLDRDDVEFIEISGPFISLRERNVHLIDTCGFGEDNENNVKKSIRLSQFTNSFMYVHNKARDRAHPEEFTNCEPFLKERTDMPFFTICYNDKTSTSVDLNSLNEFKGYVDEYFFPFYSKKFKTELFTGIKGQYHDELFLNLKSINCFSMSGNFIYPFYYCMEENLRNILSEVYLKKIYFESSMVVYNTKRLSSGYAIKTEDLSWSDLFITTEMETWLKSQLFDLEGDFQDQEEQAKLEQLIAESTVKVEPIKTVSLIKIKDEPITLQDLFPKHKLKSMILDFMSHFKGLLIDKCFAIKGKEFVLNSKQDITDEYIYSIISNGLNDEHDLLTQAIGFCFDSEEFIREKCLLIKNLNSIIKTEADNAFAKYSKQFSTRKQLMKVIFQRVFHNLKKKLFDSLKEYINEYWNVSKSLKRGLKKNAVSNLKRDCTRFFNNRVKGRVSKPLVIKDTIVKPNHYELYQPTSNKGTSLSHDEVLTSSVKNLNSQCNLTIIRKPNSTSKEKVITITFNSKNVKKQIGKRQVDALENESFSLQMYSDWESDLDYLFESTNPEEPVFPIFIPTKGRYETNCQNICLNFSNVVDFNTVIYVVVEEDELQSYKQFISHYIETNNLYRNIVYVSIPGVDRGIGFVKTLIMQLQKQMMNMLHQEKSVNFEYYWIVHDDVQYGEFYSYYSSMPKGMEPCHLHLVLQESQKAFLSHTSTIECRIETVNNKKVLCQELVKGNYLRNLRNAIQKDNFTFESDGKQYQDSLPEEAIQDALQIITKPQAIIHLADQYYHNIRGFIGAILEIDDESVLKAACSNKELTDAVQAFLEAAHTLKSKNNKVAWLSLSNADTLENYNRHTPYGCHFRYSTQMGACTLFFGPAVENYGLLAPEHMLLPQPTINSQPKVQRKQQNTKKPAKKSKKTKKSRKTEKIVSDKSYKYEDCEKYLSHILKQDNRHGLVMYYYDVKTSKNNSVGGQASFFKPKSLPVTSESLPQLKQTQKEILDEEIEDALSDSPVDESVFFKESSSSSKLSTELRSKDYEDVKQPLGFQNCFLNAFMKNYGIIMDEDSVEDIASSAHELRDRLFKFINSSNQYEEFFETEEEFNEWANLVLNDREPLDSLHMAAFSHMSQVTIQITYLHDGTTVVLTDENCPYVKTVHLGYEQIGETGHYLAHK